MGFSQKVCLRWHVKKACKGVLERSHSLLSGFLSESSETHNGGFGGDGRSRGELVRATCDLLSSLFALPDADGRALHAGLAAEGRHIGGVLADLKLLDDLPEGRTIPGGVLSADSNLLSSLGHLCYGT